jgi:hypothetical protein
MTQSSPSLSAPQIVTLLGAWPLTHPWVVPCIESWRRIRDALSTIVGISDGTLTEKAAQGLKALPIPICCAPQEQEDLVDEALERYPTLRLIRKADLTWRKLLDASIIMSRRGRTSLLIDTDVYVRRPVHIYPHNDQRSLVYMREDISAYRAAWMVAFREPMVVSFNAGLVLFNPKMIDLGFLEYAAARYIVRLKNYWWSEQLAWSLIAGRAEERFYWNGDSARVVSGFLTRSPEEISRNVVKNISRKKLVGSPSEMKLYCGDAPVIHMAGRGKRWYEAILPGDDGAESIPLEAHEDSLLDWNSKLKIAVRLFAKGCYDR